MIRAKRSQGSPWPCLHARLCQSPFSLLPLRWCPQPRLSCLPVCSKQGSVSPASRGPEHIYGLTSGALLNILGTQRHSLHSPWVTLGRSHVTTGKEWSVWELTEASTDLPGRYWGHLHFIKGQKETPSSSFQFPSHKRGGQWPSAFSFRAMPDSRQLPASVTALPLPFPSAYKDRGVHAHSDSGEP